MGTQQAERQHLEQWQEKLREREARVQRVAEALQRQQQQQQQRQRSRGRGRGLLGRLRRGGVVQVGNSK